MREDEHVDLIAFLRAPEFCHTHLRRSMQGPRRPLERPRGMADYMGVDVADRRCEVEGCANGGKLTRWMCAKHYRYWLDHTPPAQRGEAPRAVWNFWDHVTKTHEHGCWTWNGAHDPKGYGRHRRVAGEQLAHRYSWVVHNGPIPAGIWVLHHCDNSPCVNPAHLYLGTIVENTLDAIARGRVHRPPLKTHCNSGHELAGLNLRVVHCGDGTARRMCRTCDNAKSAARQRTIRADLPPVRPRLTDSERENILGLRARGLSQRRIAALTGRAFSTVQAVLKEAAA